MAKSGKKAKAGKGTSTKKAGLKFSAGAIGGRLKRGRFAKRVSKAGAVYLAAAIEYCTSELLELATKVASKGKKSTLKPRHIALAVRNDDELNKLLATVTIASGGVVPNVHPAIAKKK
jgi:histone H2A